MPKARYDGRLTSLGRIVLRMWNRTSTHEEHGGFPDTSKGASAIVARSARWLLGAGKTI